MKTSIENREKERTHAMKATVLIDNIGDGELTGEWGLSFYIEYRDKKILLDAGGASCLFAENAQKLGLSLEDVDFAVLSHAHYDHADGMTAFFEKNHKAKLYLQESCGENCWRVKEDHMKYIGIRPGTGRPHGRDRRGTDLYRTLYRRERIPGAARRAGRESPSAPRWNGNYIIKDERRSDGSVYHLNRSLSGRFPVRFFVWGSGMALSSGPDHGKGNRIWGASAAETAGTRKMR